MPPARHPSTEIDPARRQGPSGKYVDCTHLCLSTQLVPRGQENLILYELCHQFDIQFDRMAPIMAGQSRFCVPSSARP